MRTRIPSSPLSLTLFALLAWILTSLEARQRTRNEVKALRGEACEFRTPQPGVSRDHVEPCAVRPGDPSKRLSAPRGHQQPLELVRGKRPALYSAVPLHI